MVLTRAGENSWEAGKVYVCLYAPLPLFSLRPVPWCSKYPVLQLQSCVCKSTSLQREQQISTVLDSGHRRQLTVSERMIQSVYLPQLQYHMTNRWPRRKGHYWAQGSYWEML